MRNGKFSLQDLNTDPLLHAENASNWQQQGEYAARKVSKSGRGSKKRDILLEALYCALQRRCETQPPPGFNDWISTRRLAEDCEMGIYQTRSLLLKLVEQQRILVTPAPIANSLRWYIVQKQSLPEVQKSK